MRAHLETFIEHARETYDAPLPKYVREELRGYLRCGIFEHGFTRARCESCNHDVLIAFSCVSSIGINPNHRATPVPTIAGTASQFIRFCSARSSTSRAETRARVSS